MPISLIRKCLSGIITPVFIMVAAALGNLELVMHTKILIVCVLVFFASVFQPTYNPFESRSGDEGTALQIVWTVFVTQLIVMLEAYYVNYPSSMHLDEIFVLGLTLSVIGLVIRSLAYLRLKGSFTWFVEVKQGQVLVEDGVYRYLAHPSYFGALLIYAGIPVMFKSYAGLIVTLVLLLLAFSRRIKLEEKAMVDEMPKAYKRFLATRKRLLPFVW